MSERYCALVLMLMYLIVIIILIVIILGVASTPSNTGHYVRMSARHHHIFRHIMTRLQCSCNYNECYLDNYREYEAEIINSLSKSDHNENVMQCLSFPPLAFFLECLVCV